MRCSRDHALGWNESIDDPVRQAVEFVHERDDRSGEHPFPDGKQADPVIPGGGRVDVDAERIEGRKNGSVSWG